jgi:hypothetical protein
MALQITTNVTTSDGFTVQPFGFLDIQLYQPFSRALITYYKDQATFEAGGSPVNVPNLPSLVNAELTATEFWGNNLATLIHNKCITAIEEVTGADTCEIVTLEA